MCMFGRTIPNEEPQFIRTKDKPKEKVQKKNIQNQIFLTLGSISYMRDTEL